MDLPADVQIHNDIMGLKGVKGTLIMVNPHGFFEVNLNFGQNIHRVLLPVDRTAIVFMEPQPVFEADVEIER